MRRLAWLSGEDFGGLVALCQILPGPTSSQVGFLIGLRRAGWAGALAVVHGLKLTAVAVVAQALWSMARRLGTDCSTAGIALAAGALLLAFGGSRVQLAALTGGAAAGMLFCRRAAW